MRNDPTVVSSLELANREARRVATHILRAETRARRRRAPHLDGIRRTVRALLLDELARYRRRARFPKNCDFSDLTPYFIDRDGTRCAMAHLLEVGGERELVRKIARERNNARVRELANEARLIAWLDAAGLTVEEAAEIQPSYCARATDCVCTFFPPAVGVLEARVLSVTETYPLIASVEVEAIHGELPLYSVGDVLDVAVEVTPPSQTLLVPVPSDTEPPGSPDRFLFGVGLSPDGTFDCNAANPLGPQAVAYPEVPAITKEQYIELVQSETCVASLSEMDEAWTQMRCDGAIGPEPDAGADPGETGHLGTVQSDESGCSIPSSKAGEPTTLGIFLAIVTALAARRQRRATSSRSTSSFE